MLLPSPHTRTSSCLRMRHSKACGDLCVGTLIRTPPHTACKDALQTEEPHFMEDADGCMLPPPRRRLRCGGAAAARAPPRVRPYRSRARPAGTPCSRRNDASTDANDPSTCTRLQNIVRVTLHQGIFELSMHEDLDLCASSLCIPDEFRSMSRSSDGTWLRRWQCRLPSALVAAQPTSVVARRWSHLRRDDVLLTRAAPCVCHWVDAVHHPWTEMTAVLEC